MLREIFSSTKKGIIIQTSHTENGLRSLKTLYF